MTVVAQEMINAYNAEFDKRPLPSVNKAPLAFAHSHAEDEVINKYRKLPTDRVLVHKPLPSDMCHAIRQAVETMESYLSDSEIKDMIACDQCTLTAEYRPQLTPDLERIYDSLDDHDKGVLQDRLDDTWIMYCIARYTDKGAIAHEGCSGQRSYEWRLGAKRQSERKPDSNEG